MHRYMQVLTYHTHPVFQGTHAKITKRGVSCIYYYYYYHSGLFTPQPQMVTSHAVFMRPLKAIEIIDGNDRYY
jgi:hypothetical protein